MNFSSNIQLKIKKVFDLNLIYLDGNLVRANSIEAKSLILDEINKSNVVILKNFLSSEEVMNLKNQSVLLKKKHSCNRLPYTNNCRDFHHLEISSKADDKRRLSEGRKKRPRRFYLYKFLPWNFRNQLFEKSVNDIIKFRNSFYKEKFNDEKYINIPQILHYRQGGDFLGEHRDIVFHLKQGLASHIEIITLLSDLGKSFKKGGLFIKTLKKKLVFLEEHSSSGDLILYNVGNPHGCSPIDAEYDIDKNVTLEGRFILLVPPYKKSIHIKS